MKFWYLLQPVYNVNVNSDTWYFMCIWLNNFPLNNYDSINSEAICCWRRTDAIGIFEKFLTLFKF